MRFVSVVIYFFAANILGYSQDIISKVEYHRTSKVLNRGGCEGLNTLYFTNERALFVHNEYPEETVYGVSGNVTSTIVADPERLAIYTDLATNSVAEKITYLSPKVFMFLDTIAKIDWRIYGERKTIGTFNCVLATGTYGGRVYDVWFTNDIPVPFGPHRLGGLPGLILEAESRDGKVKFEFVKFESKTRDIETIRKPEIGKKVDWDGLRLHVYDNHERQMAMNPRPLDLQDPDQDWGIEKNRFKFMSEYKDWKAAQKNKKE